MPNTNMHTLNTRIKLKYDSYENWIAKDPVLLAGEVAIATVATTDAGENMTHANLPNVVLKVGDGSSKYSELKFVSALAADVHSWAKAAEKPDYTADEIDGIKEYIDEVIADHAEIQDTNTTYSMAPIDGEEHKWGLYSKEKGVEGKTLVYTLDLTSYDGRLDDIEAALGTDGSVAKAIANAIDALDYAGGEFGEHKFATKIVENNGVIEATYAQPVIADVDGLQGALDAKQDNLAFEGAYDATNNKVALKSTVTDAVAAIAKTETEEVGKFVTHMTQANGVVTTVRRELAESDIPALSIAKTTGLQDALDAKQDNLVIADDYNAESNPVATVKTVTTAVADLNGAMHFEGVVEKDPSTFTAEENGAYSAGDVVLFGIYEYVYDGAKWWPLGAEGIYQLKTDAKSEHEALEKEIDALEENKQDNLGFEGEYNKDTNKVVTKTAMDSAITTAIEALDKADAAVEHQFVTSVSEENGVITVLRAQPAIADVNGLTERLAGIDGEIAKKQDIVGFADDYNKDTNKAATVATVTNAVNALNKEDTAVEGQFVTSVSEAAGVITVARGQITTDHIQQGAKTLVFDCGTATL